MVNVKELLRGRRAWYIGAGVLALVAAGVGLALWTAPDPEPSPTP
ncbi:hypothetical protein [Phytohabitans kaempferiae]|uniref:Uncharacterized protein n=1 Tax=Phytohabitans kaempferiae TaxID=1620943 RepID=A0ABV6LX02_9ACTN